MQRITTEEGTLSKCVSTKAIDSSMRRKETETRYGNMLVVLAWMLMIIREVKISIESVLTELEQGSWEKRLKNKTCQREYNSLQSKSCVVDKSVSQSTLKFDVVWNGTHFTFEFPWVVKSISYTRETMDRIVYGYDHIRPNPTKICVHPAAIQKYVEDVIRTPNASQEDLMVHEWARYQTYGSFPRISKVQPMRLSMAGFYYTGIEDETACFSCRRRYRNWKPEDNPREIHHQMSPDCGFLNGSDNRNVAIERDDNNTDRQQQNERRHSNNSNESLQVETGASGSPKESFPTTNNHYGSLMNHTEKTITAMEKANTNGLDMGMACNNASSLGSSERRSQPDISNDGAKHPYYGIFSTRLASFTGWPSGTNLQPRDMASAGLYYMGTGDCVRCYYCGGGLRSWQNGDDPYAEHARWYPNCAYIRICRGDEFPRQHSGGTNLPPEANVEQTSTTGNDLCTSHENLALNEMRSTAAQAILSMGYSLETVTKATETIRVQRGTDFTAEQLLDLILDAEEKQIINSNGSARNQWLSDSFQRETKVSSAPTINSSSIRKEPSNARVEIKSYTDEIASDNDFESMLEENRELKKQMTCKICMDAEACIVFLPCSHMMTCPQCAPAFRKCPVCRALVRGTVRAFKS
ncbi:hypothetical protein ACJMK2_028989 [Sinanodonta woodiana]|uniref:RING-type domain-containing protein n=1 Tax=Sinanodonta woodiana TaxID=1069815 RepID=A0ABD3X9C5_SINWO